MPWLMLPALCAIGTLACFLAFCSDERIGVPQVRRWAGAAQLGVVGGVGYWLIVRGLGFSRSVFHVYGNASGFQYRAATEWALLEVGIWFVPTWVFAAWCLDRELNLPFDRASETITKACAAMGLSIMALYLAQLFSAGV